MSSVDLYRKHAEYVVERVTAVSKVRSLTEDESLLLEYYIKIADGVIPPTTRSPYRANAILARMGIKRDLQMYRYAKRPNQKVLGGTARQKIRRG